MSHDPVYNGLRETSWRRELTGAEQAELGAYLAGHPEAQADWEAEGVLNAGLHRLPGAPVSSNFTARVLQAVERESAAAERVSPGTGMWWWRVLVPRAAAALIVIGAGWFGYLQHKAIQREDLAKGLAVVATVASPPSAQVLEDFDAISRLNPARAADEELLALNEELLALTQ